MNTEGEHEYRVGDGAAYRDSTSDEVHLAWLKLRHGSTAHRGPIATHKVVLCHDCNTHATMNKRTGEMDCKCSVDETP